MAERVVGTGSFGVVFQVSVFFSPTWPSFFSHFGSYFVDGACINSGKMH
jgi:hypothetical protein